MARIGRSGESAGIRSSSATSLNDEPGSQSLPACPLPPPLCHQLKGRSAGLFSTLLNVRCGGKANLPQDAWRASRRHRGRIARRQAICLDVAIGLLSIGGVVGDVVAQPSPDGFLFFVAQMLGDHRDSLGAQLHEGPWFCLQAVGPGRRQFCGGLCHTALAEKDRLEDVQEEHGEEALTRSVGVRGDAITGPSICYRRTRVDRREGSF